MISIGPLQAGDRAEWEALFVGYMAFYERTLPPETYARAWERFRADREIHALGARLDGELVGIVHFLRHAHTSEPGGVCYLQDLFTAEAVRGKGVARALIAAVCDWAGKQGCSRVYWMTHATNARARRLYDQVAENRGFIRYQIELAS